jgi:HEAT repeat protein
MAQIVEPALGRWQYAAMRDLWRKRLGDPQAERGKRLLAIRGLGKLQDGAAARDLQKIALDRTESPELRLAASESLGGTVHAGLETVARPLANRMGPANIVDRLVAANLLRTHSSSEAQTLLVALAQDAESSVALIALRRLLEIDPGLILPFAEAALARGDANVRHAVAEALIARPSADRLAMLADLLSDRNPGVRAFVRESLLKLAEAPDLRTQIIQQGERVIQSERWQALEQSIRLLACLAHTPVADRFFVLLDHTRPEVCVTAAWGLRRLGVDKTLAPLLAWAERQHAASSKPDTAASASRFWESQVPHLFQFFGMKRYAPAEPLMRRFVPKSSLSPHARAAAIWALGYLHADQPDSELAKALEGRLVDVMSIPPEMQIVRRFSAVSLGRMKAREALPTLEMFCERSSIVSDVGYASAWSIEQMTGRGFEKPKPYVGTYTGFFLEPIAPRQ